MGLHYVPRKYLKGFAAPEYPACVWQFDKLRSAFSDSPASIKKVAQERGYYDPETETQLNELVERPANVVIDKLRNGGSLENEDRIPLAMYMATMMYRVPTKRQRAYDAIPDVLSDTIRRFKEMVTATHYENAIDDGTASDRLAEADVVHTKFAEETPKEVIEQVRQPWPTEKLVRHILSMNWYLHASVGPSYFVTSDNPMFTFDCYGVANPESEFTFPLAYNLALFGTWQPVKRRRVPDASQALVKEANRRIISAAHRFIYSHAAAEWIPAVAAKASPNLSRIMGT